MTSITGYRTWIESVVEKGPSEIKENPEHKIERKIDRNGNKKKMERSGKKKGNRYEEL